MSGTATPPCAAGLLTRRERASITRQDAFSSRWVRRPTAHEAVWRCGTRAAGSPLGAAAVLAAICLAGCGPEAPKSETYASQAQGFSVTFPADWGKTTGGLGMDLALRPPDQADGEAFRDVLFVHVEGLAEAMPLDDFFAVKAARGKKAMPDYKEIEKGAVELNGQDARRLVWSYTHAETPVQTMAYFLVSGSRGYMIAGSARAERFAQRQAAFEGIMATFKVEGAAAPAPAPTGAAAPSAAPAPAPAAPGK